MLRQTLDSATSEFAVNLLASMPDVFLQGARGGGGDDDGDDEGGVDEAAAAEGMQVLSLHRTPAPRATGLPAQQQQQQQQALTVAETPSPSVLGGLGVAGGLHHHAHAGGLGGAAHHHGAGAAAAQQQRPGALQGPGRMVDNSPSKRAPKASRVLTDSEWVVGCCPRRRCRARRVARERAATAAPWLLVHAAAGRMSGYEGYDEVIRRAETLFNRLRYAVAQQSAPTTLKAAFLEPIKTRLGLEVSLELFARSDEQFMAMFTGAARARACVSGARRRRRRRAHDICAVRWVTLLVCCSGQRHCHPPG